MCVSVYMYNITTKYIYIAYPYVYRRKLNWNPPALPLLPLEMVRKKAMSGGAMVARLMSCEGIQDRLIICVGRGRVTSFLL
jgi:hypothetical protein